MLRRCPPRPVDQARSSPARYCSKNSRLANGSTKPIKDVKVGDQVAADPRTGKSGDKRVVFLHNNHDTDLADITVQGAGNRTTTLHTTTWHHPFWNASTAVWSEAAELRPALSDQPGLAAAFKHAVERGLVDLDPWSLLTSDERVDARSASVNKRHPGRAVLCFAERRDTDDVACVVLRSSTGDAVGRVLIVHDFATPGSEVDAVFADFWDWFQAAVDDMIDTFRHWGDPRQRVNVGRRGNDRIGHTRS